MLIGPAKGQLRHYIEEASGILLSVIEEKTIEELETQIEEAIRHLNTSISLLERCNRNWANLVKDLKGDEKVKEKELALSAVQGPLVTAENHTLTVNLLKEKFGRKDVIIESLYSKLQRLPKSGNKLKEIQYVSETTERLLRELKTQDEYINGQRTHNIQIPWRGYC